MVCKLHSMFILFFQNPVLHIRTIVDKNQNELSPIYAYSFFYKVQFCANRLQMYISSITVISICNF